MELSLSLGDTPPNKKPFCQPTKIIGTKELGLFCMAENHNGTRTVRPPVQLDLLPFSPVHRARQPPPPFPWLNNNLVSEPGSNRRVGDDNVEGAASTGSSSQMDFSVLRGAIKGKPFFQGPTIADHNVNEDRSRAPSKGISDEEEFENGNNISRKKLRLTKEQAAFLEQSFKEHSTLNPKQKKTLAKQLNLCTRQVEVWFQNRRARTKLKKTEVDCEHLKRCCETLTQENRKLQKEIEELRALNKNNNNKPFYMQRPPTTLTMCPSCQRVVTTTTANQPARLLSLSS